MNAIRSELVKQVTQQDVRHQIMMFLSLLTAGQGLAFFFHIRKNHHGAALALGASTIFMLVSIAQGAFVPTVYEESRVRHVTYAALFAAPLSLRCLHVSAAFAFELGLSSMPR
jgi:cytochrome bd-type quinol oxidase subunit 2